MQVIRDKLVLDLEPCFRYLDEGLYSGGNTYGKKKKKTKKTKKISGSPGLSGGTFLSFFVMATSR